jgi:hypothetical protein
LKDKYLISAENAQLEINSLDALSSQPLIQQLSLKREEQICNNPDALNLDGLLNLLVSISSSIPRWQK